MSSADKTFHCDRATNSHPAPSCEPTRDETSASQPFR